MNVFNPFSLHGKTILVIGASSGIGREIALECAKMGATIIVAARRTELLKELVDEMPGEGHKYIVADLTKNEDIENLVKETPAVDGMLIASGIGLTLPIQFCTREKFDEVFNINFFAYTELTRLMFKKKNINKNGSIVFIASVSAFVTTPANGVYASAKGALNTFMRYAALEFAPRRIRVNTINPGMVHTSLIQGDTLTDADLDKDMNENYPLGRYGEVEDIAPLAIYLLSDASKWMTGQAIVIDGGSSL